jgi:hypothetical protein
MLIVPGAVRPRQAATQIAFDKAGPVRYSPSAPHTDARRKPEHERTWTFARRPVFPADAAAMPQPVPTPTPPLSAPTPRVLIVDQSEETREVLRFALERQGVEILEAGEAAAGLDLLRQGRPKVVVLDLDVAPDAETTYHEFNQAAVSHSGQMVILGKLGLSADAPHDRPFFAKPYHFAPLIHKIEELLIG